MLTNEQVQHLHQFCVKHYVRYYDLQVELVDHLAEAIETKLAVNPALDFETALNEVYAGFGVSGFAPVVAERMAALQRTGSKQWRKAFISWFTIPRIIITAVIFLLLYLPLQLSLFPNPQDGLLIYAVLASLLGLCMSIYSMVKFKKPKQSLLFLQQGKGADVLSWMLQVPVFYFYIMPGLTETALNTQVVNIIFTAFALCMFVCCLAQFDVRRKRYIKALTLYPKAFENN